MLGENGYPYNAGSYKVVVTGIGSYRGTVTKEFEIKPQDIAIKPLSASKYYGQRILNLNLVIVSTELRGGNSRMLLKAAFHGRPENTWDHME